MALNLNKSSLSARLITFFVIVAAIPVILGSVLSYYIAARALRDNTFDRLEVTAYLKQDQIESLIIKQSNMLESLSRTEVVKSIADKHLAGETIDDSDIVQLQSLLDLDEDFEELFFIDAESGEVVTSTNVSQIGLPKQNTPYYRSGVESLYVQDIYVDPQSESARYSIALPVSLGVFGAHMKLDAIDDIVDQVSGLGDTGETYLISRTHQFLSESRFVQGSRFNLTVNTDQTEAVFKGLEAGHQVYKNYRNAEVIGVFHNLSDRNMALFVEIETSEVYAPLKSFLVITAFIVFLLGTALVVVIVGMARLYLKPFNVLIQGVKTFGEGDLDKRIDIQTHDEIKVLADTFNRMAHSIQDSIVKLQKLDKMKSEFLMIASHNLRTPLSIMNDYIDTMRSLGKANDEDISKMIDVLQDNTKRLAAFSENMLTIANLEVEKADNQLTGSKLSGNSLTSIYDIITKVEKDFAPLAQEKNIKFTVFKNLQHDAPIFSENDIYGMIWNILENSLRFTNERGVIFMDIVTDRKNVKIKLSDSGIGIKEEEMPDLFVKFHRGTSTLKYDYEGTGLGLYMVKLLVDRNHGTIDIRSIPGEGTSVTITLPFRGASLL